MKPPLLRRSDTLGLGRRLDALAFAMGYIVSVVLVAAFFVAAEVFS